MRAFFQSIAKPGLMLLGLAMLSSLGKYVMIDN